MKPIQQWYTARWYSLYIANYKQVPENQMDLCSRAHRVVTLLFAPQVTPLHWLHIFKDSFQPRTAAQSSACSKISASVWVTESLLSVASHTSSRNVVCCRPIQTYTTLSRRCQGVLSGRTEALWQQCLRVHDRWCAMKAVQAGEMMRYDPKLVGRERDRQLEITML